MNFSWAPMILRPTPWSGRRHRVRVEGFWIDQTEVTNSQFQRFVEATGYKTTAERPVDWEQLKTQVSPGTAKPPDEQLARLTGLHTSRPPRSPGRHHKLVEVGSRRKLAPPRWTRQLDRWQG